MTSPLERRRQPHGVFTRNGRVSFWPSEPPGSPGPCCIAPVNATFAPAVSIHLLTPDSGCCRLPNLQRLDARLQEQQQQVEACRRLPDQRKRTKQGRLSQTERERERAGGGVKKESPFFSRLGQTQELMGQIVFICSSVCFVTSSFLFRREEKHLSLPPSLPPSLCDLCQSGSQLSEAIEFLLL